MPANKSKTKQNKTQKYIVLIGISFNCGWTLQQRFTEVLWPYTSV